MKELYRYEILLLAFYLLGWIIKLLILLISLKSMVV